MKKYIFGRRDTIHIIDLTQTVELVKKALEKVYETISNRGKFYLSQQKNKLQIIQLHLQKIPVNFTLIIDG